MNNQFVVYLIKTLKILLAITLAIFLVRSFVLEPGRVNGRSMEKTMIDEDLFFVNKFTLLYKPPQRGQIVQFIEPENKTLTIKRIIGLPGETINIKQNHIYITPRNGTEFRLEEPYLTNNIHTEAVGIFSANSLVVKENEYFVLGDNRTQSKDSRYYGTINRAFILGLVVPTNN
ncbi:MAG: signal peptidase I [Candidatus Kerfeldbacteria bacterium RIFOXYA2_FULL_38_24]|uniref:Signal peptidase I n=1 Tax=Candidatus Kerfeldbacteria bacterium RIFOXYB2_FULL_38_14 TaxID=1798547 RepID=A0A1G2B9R7_9BACT|nr:MAG: signal peptidase I [Candidatus Kerfeldbacteria bacterium RIFOXYB2_FULL_38_14]OGY86471.1 MAG: signal peptidase I [Candidatus Kerfeldbacteria bacterium RIFOXYA2_FULL_38_24]